MKVYDDQLIVVTGGAGFIGSAVIGHLNSLGFDNILVVDQLCHSNKWQNLVGKRFVDMLEKDQLFDWLKGRESTIEAFIHLGACTSTVETDASYLLQNNYRFSLNLAEYALHHDKRFIYASSAATYGNGEQGFSDDETRLEILRPLNMYGYSKHLFDLWAKGQGVLNKMVGLKYFNVYGPNEYHKGRMASAITRMLPQAKEEGVIRLFKSSDPKTFADGEQKRDFIYVKDAARMTCEFLSNEAAGIFNIGMGVATSWNTLAKAVFKAIGKPIQIEYIWMPEDLVGKYQNFTQADMKKTNHTLKAKAQTMPIEEAVTEYIQKYLLKGERW